MMEVTQDLIERLRVQSIWSTGLPPYMAAEAAAALTTATAEAEALKHDLEQSMDTCAHYVNECAKLEAEADALKKLLTEKDAMIHQLGENAATAAKEYADSMAALRAEVEALRKALVNHNDVLRSAYQIAARKGAQTEWEGFTLRAGSVLHFHHEEVEAARAALERQP